MSVIKDGKIYVECGSSCLQDFLATDKISSIVWMAQFTQTLGDIISEGRELSGRCNPVYELERVIATAIKSISDRGYYSRAKAEEFETCSTAGEVMYMINGDRYNKIPPYRPTAEEREEAKKVIEYIKTITTETDYKYNLHTIANNENGYVSGRFVGYAVSMVVFYRKQLSFIKENKTKTISTFVGDVKDKLTLSLIFLGVYTFDSFYGVVNINRFKDENGNVFIWKTSTQNECEIGNVYTIKGIVKEHQEYKNEKQTVLKNCKIVI